MPDATEIEQTSECRAELVLARGIGVLVRDGDLDAAQREPVVDDLLGIGERDLLDLRAEIGRYTQTLGQHPGRIAIGAFAGPAPVDAIVTPRRLPDKLAR